MIELQDICKTYQMGQVQVEALCGLDLEIEEGEMTSIMGPSGSGKSTLMNIMGCLDQATRGRYVLDGIDVSRLNDDQLAEIRARKIGFVFQNYNLLRRTTALQNVELPLIYTGARNRRERAIEALTTVGLGDRIHHRPNEMSGGEQQRVAVARSIINNPSIILADEPTGNLDTKTGRGIVALFQELNETQGITVVFVTHDPEIADHCRRIVHIRDGRLESLETVANPLSAKDWVEGDGAE
ncbi:MAG: ABC transporter ATP-binding protein [Anaerolineae bacterium]|nr:ABC transporter ATP-binding protein [Anaerolineae bacterium]